MKRKPELHGLMAVFDEPERLVEAAREVRLQGYRHFDAYSPFPVEDLSDAIGSERAWVAPLCWLGGFGGVVTAFAWQSWDTVASFPLNVGGRPYFSWPAYVPITFELMVLFAGTFTFFGVLALNRLPRYHHPVFNIEEFQKRNSSDGFFLVIEARDRKFDLARTAGQLRELGAIRIHEVPHEP